MSFSFDPLIYSLLGKVLNFSLAPRKKYLEDIICGIDYGIRELPDNIKDIIRKYWVIFLKKVKPSKNNICKAKFDALKSLNGNQGIVVLKVDKGGAIVILDMEDYQSKMVDHLSSSRSYRKLNKNPLNNISRTVALAIKSSKHSYWSNEKVNWYPLFWGSEKTLNFEKWWCKNTLFSSIFLAL